MAQPKNKQAVLKAVLDKVKMEDSGTKNGGCCPEPVCSTSENKVRYPCLFLTSEEAPCLVGHEVEHEVEHEMTLVIKAVIVGRRVNAMKGQEKKENFDLEIREIGLAGMEKESKESKE